MMYDTVEGILLVLHERAWVNAEDIRKEFDERFFLEAEFRDALDFATGKGYTATSARSIGRNKYERIYSLSSEGKKYIRNAVRAKFGLVVEDTRAAVKG